MPCSQNDLAFFPSLGALPVVVTQYPQFYSPQAQTRARRPIYFPNTASSHPEAIDVMRGGERLLLRHENYQVMRYEFPGRRSAAGYTIATFLPFFLIRRRRDGAAAAARNSILSLATPPPRRRSVYGAFVVKCYVNRFHLKSPFILFR